MGFLWSSTAGRPCWCGLERKVFAPRAHFGPSPAQAAQSHRGGHSAGANADHKMVIRGRRSEEHFGWRFDRLGICCLHSSHLTIRYAENSRIDWPAGLGQCRSQSTCRNPQIRDGRLNKVSTRSATRRTGSGFGAIIESRITLD